MAQEAFIYRGFEIVKNYNGHWTLFLEGETMSTTSRPSKDDATRWIDKYWKEQGK